MWIDITALHVGASYFDPSLKTFLFAKDSRERKNLLQQVVKAARENAYFVTDESEDSDIECIGESPDSDVEP